MKTRENAVARVAEPELKCKQESLKFTPPKGNESYWQATGCDQAGRYAVTCNMFSCTATSATAYEQQLAEQQRLAEEQRLAAAAAGPPPSDGGGSGGSDGGFASGGPAPTGGGSSSAPQPASQHVSITLINECKQTVKLFFGDKPKFGSGRNSSIGSNTRTSHSGTAGDMIWITDDSGNGISSATLAVGMREVRITESCTGMSAR